MSNTAFFREVCKQSTERLNATPEKLVDDLIYFNYRHNRTISPEVTPERWEKIYGPNTMAMEERFQAEPPQEQTVAQECPAVHGEDCTDDHCQCDCHFSYDDPYGHEDSREVNGR